MATSTTSKDDRALVLDALRSLKPPVHIAALAQAFKAKSGRNIKEAYKGGMLRFVKLELADEVVLMGEGNDAFVRLATPTTRAASWVRECVQANGPILASMVGRLYHEATGTAFNTALPDAGGIIKYMRNQLADDLSFEAQKVSIDFCPAALKIQTLTRARAAANALTHVACAATSTLTELALESDLAALFGAGFGLGVVCYPIAA